MNDVEWPDSVAGSDLRLVGLPLVCGAVFLAGWLVFSSIVWGIAMAGLVGLVVMVESLFVFGG